MDWGTGLEFLGWILAFQYLEVNKLKHRTILRCRNIALLLLRWVVTFIKTILCVWIEMRRECTLPEESLHGQGTSLGSLLLSYSEDGVMCWQLGGDMQNKSVWRNFETEDWTSARRCYLISLHGGRRRMRAGTIMNMLWGMGVLLNRCYWFIHCWLLHILMPSFLTQQSSLKFRFWGSWIRTHVYEMGLVLFDRLLGKDIGFLPVLYEDVNSTSQIWLCSLLTAAPRKGIILESCFFRCKVQVYLCFLN